MCHARATIIKAKEDPRTATAVRGSSFFFLAQLPVGSLHLHPSPTLQEGRTMKNQHSYTCIQWAHQRFLRSAKLNGGVSTVAASWAWSFR